MVQEQDEGMSARKYRCASRGRLRGGLRIVKELPTEFATQAANQRHRAVCAWIVLAQVCHLLPLKHDGYSI